MQSQLEARRRASWLFYKHKRWFELGTAKSKSSRIPKTIPAGGQGEIWTQGLPSEIQNKCYFSLLAKLGSVAQS